MDIEKILPNYKTSRRWMIFKGKAELEWVKDDDNSLIINGIFPRPTMIVSQIVIETGVHFIFDGDAELRQVQENVYAIILTCRHFCGHADIADIHVLLVNCPQQSLEHHILKAMAFGRVEKIGKDIAADRLASGEAGYTKDVWTRCLCGGSGHFRESCYGIMPCTRLVYSIHLIDH